MFWAVSMDGTRSFGPSCTVTGHKQQEYSLFFLSKRQQQAHDDVAERNVQALLARPNVPVHAIASQHHMTPAPSLP